MKGKFLFSFLFLSIILPQNVCGVASNEINVPIGRYGHEVVYNHLSDTLILFGGSKNNQNTPESYLNDLWIFSPTNNTWIRKESTLSPEKRLGHELVYDSLNNQVILFGGGNEKELFNDTWILNCETYEWVKINSTACPPSANDPEMVLDSSNNHIILFGGYLTSGYSGETWKFFLENRTWIKLDLDLHPSPRYGHRMTFNSNDRIITLFGGHADNGLSDEIMNDIWMFNGSNNSWIELNIDNNPPTRYWHEFCFDQVTGEYLLYAGRMNANGFTCRTDTWILNKTNIWEQKEISDGPTGRMFSSMASTRDKKSYLFGGTSDPNSEIFDDLWMFDFEKYTWSAVQISQNDFLSPFFGISGILIGVTVILILRKSNTA